MSTPYEAGGRSAQKARTRDALIAAARDLVAAGVTPTVEEAAEAASISRTTAYRYFPSQRALLLAAHPEMAATSIQVVVLEYRDEIAVPSPRCQLPTR